jgi:hypothetical protein
MGSRAYYIDPDMPIINPEIERGYRQMQVEAVEAGMRERARLVREANEERHALRMKESEKARQEEQAKWDEMMARFEADRKRREAWARLAAHEKFLFKLDALIADARNGFHAILARFDSFLLGVGEIINDFASWIRGRDE